MDIRTEGGAATVLTGVFLDAYGQFTVGEGIFTEDVVNYIRIKSEADESTLYSAPVTLQIDSTVDGTSANQVKAMSVSRDGNDVTVRWRYFSTNSNTTNLYYTPEGGVQTLLTTSPLLPGARSPCYPKTQPTDISSRRMTVPRDLWHTWSLLSGRFESLANEVFSRDRHE